MNTLRDRIEQWEFNRERTLETLKAIAETKAPQAVLSWQPGPGRAHIAWQLMHIAVTEGVFAMMHPDFQTTLSQDLLGRFRKGSVADERVPSLDEIRDTLELTRGHLLATMKQFTDDDLGVVPASLKERGWNLGMALKIVAWHEPHHQGQAHLTFNLWKAGQGE